MNKMQELRIEKVTLNIGTGGPGENLNKAVKLLNKISKAKAVTTKAKKRIPTWGVRPGLEIGSKVTIRGKKAVELLKKLLKAKGNKLIPRNFDETGNFSFGITEYFDIPGVEYDSEIGMRGLEAAVTLERPGFRIKKRKIKKSNIGNKHKITKDDAIKFIEEKFNVKVEEEE